MTSKIFKITKSAQRTKWEGNFDNIKLNNNVPNSETASRESMTYFVLLLQSSIIEKKKKNKENGGMYKNSLSRVQRQHSFLDRYVCASGVSLSLASTNAEWKSIRDSKTRERPIPRALFSKFLWPNRLICKRKKSNDSIIRVLWLAAVKGKEGRKKSRRERNFIGVPVKFERSFFRGYLHATHATNLQCDRVVSTWAYMISSYSSFYILSSNSLYT